MDDIDDLRVQLARINVDALSFWDVPEIPIMENIASELLRKVHRLAGAKGASFPNGRTLQAIRSFRLLKHDVDQRSLRLVAYASCLWIEEDGYALVADPTTLETFLSAAKASQKHPRVFRQLYNGLLNAYFTADRYADWFDADVKTAFEILRRFLSDTRSYVSELQPRMSYIDILEQHPELLGDLPGSYLASKWLAGEQGDLQNITAKLSITGNSWLVIETVRAALTEATGKVDSRFIEDIPILLAAAADVRFQVIRDEIYATILTRYARMQSAPAHPELRDAVVAAWKNPWLPRNDGAWGRVSEQARKMVTGWLKLEFIHQFFEVLSDDRQQDRRRFEFWRTYHEQIDDVYFALGSDAYRSTHPDLVKLRKDLEGRLLELTGVPPKTHAFIMCMGSRIIVEFSQTANAVHTFSVSEFAIDSTSKSTSISRLKIANGPDRWIHRGDWEEDFHRRLSNKPSPRNAVCESHNNVARVRPRSTSPQATEVEAQISSFALAQNIRVEDRRRLGGNLWLFYNGFEPYVIANLKAWGFSHAPNKGWWRPK